MRTILFIAVMACAAYDSFAQQKESRVDVATVTNQLGTYAVLKASAKGLSGDLSFLWNTENGEFTSDRTDPVVSVPYRPGDRYTLFIRDGKTGALYAEDIILGAEKVSLRVYPNPSREQLFIEVENETAATLENISVYSENSTIPVKSVSTKELISEQQGLRKIYKMNVRELSKGTYYLHINGKNDALSKKIRIMLE